MLPHASDEALENALEILKKADSLTNNAFTVFKAIFKCVFGSALNDPIYLRLEYAYLIIRLGLVQICDFQKLAKQG